MDNCPSIIDFINNGSELQDGAIKSSECLTMNVFPGLVVHSRDRRNLIK